MKKLLFLILFTLLPLTSNALTEEKAREFLNYLKEGNFCSKEFYSSFKATELKEPALFLFVDSCFSSGKYEPILEFPEVPQNPYVAFEKAVALKRVGRKKESLEIFRKIFSTTNELDEDILIENLGNWNSFFTPSILRKKVLRALSERDFETAHIYLYYLEGDPYYTYLRGILLLKQGKRREAKELLESSSVPKKFVYLTYLSKDPMEKLYYFKRALRAPIPERDKRGLTVYLLDKFLYSYPEYLERVLSLIKGRYPDLFTDYHIKRNVLSGRYREALKELSKLKGEKYDAWKVAISAKYFGKYLPFNYKRVSFYTLLLNPKDLKGFIGQETESENIEDSGIRLLYDEKRCDVISLMDGRSPDVAVAHYLCGIYSRALKEAARFKRQFRERPLLLKVLYPAPPLFKEDLVSLSLTRQESLFNERALSRSGAMGLMQIMPFTGKYIAEKLGVSDFEIPDLFNPEVNYRFGSYYIGELLKSFKLFPIAAAAYNAGPTRIKRALKKFGPVRTPYDLVIFVDFYIPFEETRNYVKRVMVNYYFYSKLYGKGDEWRIFSPTWQKKVTARTPLTLTGEF
ncbi:lytic transglycosylase domain-containing protein [Phorcysia thermohydrogeniphila]|uniref:Soluble lytic murein transglycosylase n=1 Tax=Phorcysia thermohydrogeniphila TaxID=936138 RepID=A0A4R1GA59_9BACT|nr:lytic transglycosylase domain-containing protein [Phorcysia thermohydrogeniphila]TCK03325.1 soluble lytic murein transglycosylase [Phorcysia thermohydrogeniphila]